MAFLTLVSACGGGALASSPSTPGSSMAATGTAAADEALQAKTRNLVENLVHGDYSGARKDFDFTMRSHLDADQLAEAWQKVEAQVGTFEAVERVRTEHKGLYSFLFARCRFSRGEKVVQVTYDADGNVAGLFYRDPPVGPAWTAPPYADRDAFEERAVHVGSAPELPGILSVPKGPGPFPAVVLVHGSGPLDADETVGQIKVFKDLAFGLSSRGVVYCGTRSAPSSTRTA
jgi:Protein of unknown function (DUF3887)